MWRSVGDSTTVLGAYLCAIRLRKVTTAVTVAPKHPLSKKQLNYACETLDAHGMAHYDAFYSAFDIMIARACALIIELPVVYQAPLVLRLHDAQPQFIDTNLEEQFAKYGFDRW